MFSRCGLSLHVPVTRLLASRGASPSADLCKSKSPTAEAPPRPVRRAEFYAGGARWVWMQVLQYRRGDRCSFEPGRCSRSLLGQSVTRQVGAAGRSIAPSSQVLPVIPMPGGERSWRTAATLFLLQLQFFGDCSLDWICNKSELALARFEVGWTAGARNSSATSSSAPVVSFAAAFDKLIVFVLQPVGAVVASMSLQLKCKARFMLLALSCSFFHPVTLCVRSC